MIEVKFKGQNFNNFDSIAINTSLDDISGEFSLHTTPDNNYPFGIGDFIQVMVDGSPMVSGFIEKSSGSIQKDSSEMTYSGRDLLGDLIDSSVPDSISVNNKSISLQNLCLNTIKTLGIKAKVINLAGTLDPFTENEIEAIGFGGKAAEFLQSFARKRGVFLTTDGLGNLVIFTPPTALETEIKLTVDSMTVRQFSYDNSQRFNIIRVGSQDNNAATDESSISEGTNRTQSFVDNDIRSTRYLEVSAEETMNNSELLRRAKEEVNIRRARGFQFSCEVQSHGYVKGKLIRMDDPLSGVKGTFLIRSVTYNQSLDTGNTSNLTICFPESYSSAGKRVSLRKSKMTDQKDETIFPVFNNPNARLLL